MTVRTPTPKHPHPTRRRRYIPDRPAGGYHVRPLPVVTSDLAGLDHGAEIRTAIGRLDETDALLLRLEARIDRMVARLTDPALAVRYPPDDPVRIEAEDRLAVLAERWNLALANATQWAADISAHGDYLIRDGQGDDLDAIGRQLLTHGWGALGRVQDSIDGLMTGYAWQRLAAAAVPF